MQREIKFRAWDKKLKIMREVDSIDFISSNLFCWDDKKDEEIDLCFNRCPERDEAILMQYTGLKDKSGREIYEGDIIQWAENHCCYEKGDKAKVCMDQGGFSPFSIASDIGEHEWIDGINDGEIEIIGNIYENPELLTNK